jgi:hypothetical protein
MTQLNLIFIDLPLPESCLGEQFEAEQKRLVVETLARLLLKATIGTGQEPSND